MPKDYGETTAPAAAGRGPSARRPDFIALVIAWSYSQPHRVGEVAFLPYGVRLLFGRGGAGLGPMGCFGRDRPGVEFAVDPREGLLGGDTVSREQLGLRSMGVEAEMDVVGRCPTFVNGEQRDSAILQPGDTILLENEVLLLCVQRPKMLALPPGLRELHPYGWPDADRIVGEGPGCWRLREQIALAAVRRKNVLVLGDSGTGKRLTAGALHRQSERAKGPFVMHNAAAFSPALIESQLFGNRANYPNPGMPASKGLVGEADGGTLFLDEIGDCPYDVQTQLLGVIETGEYHAVGETRVQRADVRLVGATNKPESSMRHDFFGRFDGRVRIPPLRERREDIPLLIRHLLVSYAQDLPDVGARFLRTGPDGQLWPKIDPRLVDHFLRHPLPLNTRDLDTMLKDAIDASAGDELTMPDLEPLPRADASSTRPPSLLPEPAPRRGPAASGPPPKEEVIACLARERTAERAAKSLGITRPALYALMAEYGIKKRRED